MLLVAEDDAAVGEVRVRRLVGDGLLRITVERQGNAVVPGQIEQARQQIRIAVGGDEQIGIMLLEQVLYAEDELAAVAAGEGMLAAVDFDQQVAAVPARRIAQFAGQAQRHDPERRQPVFGLPGGIERLQVEDLPGLVFDGAVGQGENAAAEDVALWQRDVGVVVGQVGKGIRRLAEEAREGGWLAHADLQHLNGAIEEQVGTFGAAQL